MAAILNFGSRPTLENVDIVTYELGENLENGHFQYEKKIFFSRSISTVIASGIYFMPLMVLKNHQQRLLMDLLIYLAKPAFIAPLRS